ncbi:MAG: hypothetical protein JSV80_13620 [Acidobacteriota bacterium]|nr:MAG: hypothetical protein JSV80_13620 [Acidobacteriota bacterium]
MTDGLPSGEGVWMGEVVTFPSWSVITRDEGRAPGEPSILVDPHGRRHAVEEVVRRRLIAAADPALPVRRETLLRAAGGLFLVVYTEGAGRWQVHRVDDD